jgi:hypothetical protein
VISSVGPVGVLGRAGDVRGDRQTPSRIRYGEGPELNFRLSSRHEKLMKLAE